MGIGGPTAAGLNGMFLLPESLHILKNDWLLFMWDIVLTLVILEIQTKI